MNITEQKEIADELLNCLEIICPHAILAGGAPRDWYMDTPCNDLDFYISLPEGLQSGRLRKMIERVLPEGVEKVKNDFKSSQDPMYKHMKALRNIYYYTYKGVEFQLIRLESVSDVYQAVDNMSCSVCKAWYKNGEVGTHKDFKITMKSGMMFLNENYKWSDYHPVKMKERFSGKFALGTEVRAKKIIMDKALEDL